MPTWFRFDDVVDAVLAGRLHNPSTVMGVLAADRARARGWEGLREAGANGILLSGDRQEGSVWPKVFLKKLPPGRAQWVTRSGKPQMVQLAFYDQEGRNGL